MISNEFEHNVLDMVLATAARRPDAVAVICGDAHLTYAGLLAAAEANAAHLARLEIGHGDMVLCALAHGVELPVAWLAVMMLGAVIVPVDPCWPAARLAAVAAATRARLAFAHGDQAFLREAGLALAHIVPAGGPADLPARRAPSGDDLLYGFFTSGSTGTPKCALNHHAGLVNRFAYMTRRFGPDHVVYQNSAPLFDSSIWQMLWPLTAGAVTVMPQSRERWDLEAVVAHIERYGVTMLDFVPTLFKLLVRALEQGSLAPRRIASLRNILIGGEEIDVGAVQAFRRLLPGCRIINTYGHTEASIGMVFHEVTDADGDHIPLGRPIDNTFVRIVDGAMQPLPAGEFGEIVVAGVCVGKGYLNAPELTARAFVPNPFPDLPGSTVYRSGDIGRMRADGLLEFSGRADDQVKVRGVRVELGEIALAMRTAFPDVQDALALAVPNAQRDLSTALVYVAPAPLDLAEVRAALARHLPRTHMPHLILHLAGLPVSANGKTDRAQLVRRLSEMNVQADAPAADGLLPKIVNGYRSVLSDPRADADSNFFDLGGDSLAAVNLVLMLEADLDRAVPVTAVYRHPTPRAMARFLDGADAAAQAEPAEQAGPAAVSFTNRQAPAAVSEHLLLTGATGFVGIHVLGHLLATTRLRIAVLLRGRTREGALARLDAAFCRAFPGRELDPARIDILLGDLALPHWGLAPDEWLRQAGRIDEVMHCGANVNFLSHVSQLQAANVGGTVELVRFCNEGRAKRVHHVSSLAARAVEGTTGMTGYAWTKYRADCVIAEAQVQGLAAKIYRVDDVLPSISVGCTNDQSLVHLLLMQCLDLGVAPDGCGSLGLLAVDALAQWLCAFVGTRARFDQAPPLTDVVGHRFVPFDELAQFAARRLGRALRPVSYRALCDALRDAGRPETVLLHDMLPAPDSGAVPFTRTPPAPGPQRAFPHAQLLGASLADFAAFGTALARQAASAGA